MKSPLKQKKKFCNCKLLQRTGFTLENYFTETLVLKTKENLNRADVHYFSDFFFVNKTQTCTSFQRLASVWSECLPLQLPFSRR